MDFRNTEQNALSQSIQEQQMKSVGYRIVQHYFCHGKTISSLSTTIAITCHPLPSISLLYRGFTIYLFPIDHIHYNNELICM